MSEPYRSYLNIKRNFFTGRFESVYDLHYSAALTQDTALQLAHLLLESVVPKEALKERELLDLKGRDRNNTISAASFKSQFENELFYLSGSYDIEQGDDLEPLQHEFSAALITPFLSFEGAAHIKHRCESVFSGTPPEGFALKRVKDFPEVGVRTVRLGLDLYQPHAFGFIGFAPIVTQTVLLDFNSSSLQMRITARNLKARDQLPLQRRDLLTALNSVFKQLLRIDIIENYVSLIR
ncbi:MAG: hypothetical protein J5J00_08290 [Deltaproteobacteria bacterium]|nr:hypothetical protein [Deltaproteobacteria bacterium]